MRAIRRLLQVVALVGTILVGIVAVALIVSQTPWFKDWLRRYIVRESKQYMNGQLTIGGLGGNLLFGVDLSDVAVDVSGERIVAVKGLQLDYSMFELISKGMVLDDIKIDRPVIQLERTANGWNVANLVKKQQREADRRGPGRPLSMPSIEISDAIVSIHDRLAAEDCYNLPGRIDDLDVKAAFAYEPVHYSLTLDHVSFRGSAPSLTVQQLSGKVSVRDDNLYVERVALTLADTSMTVDGVVEQYLQTPVVKLTTIGNASLPEIGRIVPAAAGYALHPAFTIKADGPADRLGLEVDVRSEAGNVSGTMTADVMAPDLGVRADLHVEHLNLAPILKDPAQKTDLTGQARVSIRMTSQPASVPVMDRVAGTFAFNGPHAAALGYEARNVDVSGRLQGPRISLDGRAAAYGGTATASGVIVAPAPGRPLSFDLRGKAAGVNLRNLPASTGVPQLATDLSVSEYHVAGEWPSINGRATFQASTVEAAKIAQGTVAQFNVDARTVDYSARGEVSDLNLQRIGRGLKVSVLNTPQYDSRVNGSFDVKGSLPRRSPEGESAALRSMTLDAHGTLRDSGFMGGRIPSLDFETHLANGGLSTRLNGEFEGFNPAKLTQRPQLDGTVSGTVDATLSMRDVTAPITPDAIAADGRVAITRSTVGGLEIDSANADGHFASQTGDIRQVNVTGPGLKAQASGHVALDRTGQSNVTYHVDAVDLAKLGAVVGQEGLGGAATVDGRLTGNATLLQADGTLKGSSLAYRNSNALGLITQYTITVPDFSRARVRVQANTDATFVETGGVKLNAVKATTLYAGDTIDFTANLKEEKRELDATGRVILHPDHQEIHLARLAVRTQGVEWSTPDGNAAIEYGGGRITLKSVRLVSADQAIDVTGGIATGEVTPTGEARAEGLTIHARNIDLQQLQTLMLQDRGLGGRLTADATISGSTSAPAVDGRVEIKQGAFRAYQYDSFTATMNYTGKRVAVDATLQQSPTESITARGTVPTTLFQRSAVSDHVAAAGEDRVDLHITSTQLGLGAIEGVTGLVTNVTGTVQADVHVLGSGEDPHLQGYVDIKDGGFGAPGLGETYSGLTTRIDLQPDRVQVQGFEVKDRHGERLRVQGELAVHERSVGAVNVSIDSDNFELLHNELGDVQVQSALKVTGDVRRPRIGGDVRVDAGRIEVDRLLELSYDPYSVQPIPDVESAERRAQSGGSAEDATREALERAKQSAAPAGAKQAAAEQQPPAPGGAFAPVSLDIHLVVPDDLVIRGKNLRPGGASGMSVGNVNMTLGGDLQVRKDPDAQITLVGEVNTVRGTYEFQGRRFDLVRDGTLRFTGDTQLNPLLDISATRQIPNTGVEARVHITGTANAPELALSSTPPLEESDILALIVFNRSVNELGSGERSSLAATAGGIATGFIAQPLGESIARALDLDLFEISPSTENGDLGASVTLGQQIGDRAFVKLQQSFGNRTTSEFIVEYQLAKFLRLKATVAPETTGAANRVNQVRVERGGIDVIFFFSY